MGTRGWGPEALSSDDTQDDSADEDYRPDKLPGVKVRKKTG